MNRNILVVDDDPHIQELLKFFLEQAGYYVGSCGDGYSAVDEINNNPYDLVIMDINMPYMNGVKAIRTYRQNSKQGGPEFLVLTSSADSQNVVELSKYGIKDYLIKPPNKDDLLKRVERILGNKPQFEKIDLDEGSAIGAGVFSLDVRLVSVSAKGLILSLPVELPENFVIEDLNLKLFEKLNIGNMKHKPTRCGFEEESGKYLYFLSFVGMNADDVQKVRDWVMETSYSKKNAM